MELGLSDRLMTITASDPTIIKADARFLDGLIAPKTVDLIVTSPPYWGCRDYEHPDQLGQEKSAQEYLDSLIAALNSWKPFLRSHATVFINIDDVFRNKSLVGIPSLFEIQVKKHGWLVVNRIVWVKNRGLPEPNPYRFSHRYEFVFQLAQKKDFFSDLFALKEYLGHPANPTDVWLLGQIPSKSSHVAPFPLELARRAIIAACPERICSKCGQPYKRKLAPSKELNPKRAQSKRAMELFQESGLTEEHLVAIRAVGISDAGKGQKIQNGANKNSVHTLKLAKEAKEKLGGYFREFTFAPKQQVGWDTCSCDAEPIPGNVLDPFMGSGTTLKVAFELGRNSIGVDLMPPATV